MKIDDVPDHRAHYMLKRIYDNCGEQAMAACVLGLPQEGDNFTLQEWDDTYKYLCSSGLIRALGANYSSSITQSGIQLVKQLPEQVPPPKKSPAKQKGWKFWEK